MPDGSELIFNELVCKPCSYKPLDFWVLIIMNFVVDDGDSDDAVIHWDHL